MHKLPSKVKIVEVGPRDGLQNEDKILKTEHKIRLINELSVTGLRHIEAGAFVSPEAIPQLADSDAVFKGIQRHESITYSALVPNMRGLQRALEAEAGEVAFFTAASETFCKMNTHCGLEESFQRLEPVVAEARSRNVPVRAYVSCVLGCPYEGDISLSLVREVAEQCYRMGCAEISLGDTVGWGTPLKARRMIESVSQVVPLKHIAVHFHDTRGQALANILACLQAGVATVDAAVAGLGGCPYAPGAGGNVATEDLVYMLHGMGIETGVHLNTLIKTGFNICKKLHRNNQSRVALSMRKMVYADC